MARGECRTILRDAVRAIFREHHCTLTGWDGNSWTVLHHACACSGDNIGLLHTLICEHNAYVNVRNKNNDTLLHVAAEEGKCDVALSLINDFGCDPNALGSNRDTLLHHACRGGNTDLVLMLLGKHNADISVRNNVKDTPLHVAAGEGKLEMVLSVISQFEFHVNAQGYNGETLLHHACRKGSMSTMSVCNDDKVLLGRVNGKWYSLDQSICHVNAQI